MRKHLVVLTSFFVLAAAACTSPASAGWGCGAQARDGSQGRAWAEPNEAQARKDALKYCAGEGHRCKIVSCSENVDTQDKAHALWPPNAPVDKCFGTGPCKTGQ